MKLLQPLGLIVLIGLLGACVEEIPPPPPKFDPGPKLAWKHTASKITAKLGSPNHRGQDVVVNTDLAMVLIGKFAYSPLLVDKDIKDERVDVWMQYDPHKAWTKLGSDHTSHDGEHGTTHGFEDDGGRIFYTLKPDQRPDPGRYPVRMVCRGDLARAEFDLHVVTKGTKAVLFDIDGTLSIGDGELLHELIDDMIGGSYSGKAYADAAKVASAYHDKGYLIVYLTGRPEVLHRMTREWLTENGFPDGIRHLTDSKSQSLPTDSGVMAYKRDYIKYLTDSVGIDIAYAYGNASTDIKAYEEAGLSKATTFVIGKHAGAKGTVALTSYTAHLPFVAKVPDTK